MPVKSKIEALISHAEEHRGLQWVEHDDAVAIKSATFRILEAFLDLPDGRVINPGMSDVLRSALEAIVESDEELSALLLVGEDGIELQPEAPEATKDSLRKYVQQNYSPPMSVFPS